MFPPVQLSHIRPSPDLAPWVAWYDVVECYAPGTSVSGISLPINNIVFHYGGAVRYEVGERILDAPRVSFDGVVRGYWQTHIQDSCRFISAQLRPFILHHLIQGNVAELTNNAGHISDFGLKGAENVEESLRETGTDVFAKLRIVEDYLRSVFREEHLQAPDRIKNHIKQLQNDTFRQNSSAFSERHLRREFVKYIGIPPSQYRDIKRIKAACHILLAGSRRNLTCIAQDLGFYDLSHFNRAFKRYTGEPPSHYRRAALENPMREFLLNN